MSTNNTTKIFVNLPVKDLPKAKEFFGKLGFNFNAQISDTPLCLPARMVQQGRCG